MKESNSTMKYSPYRWLIQGLWIFVTIIQMFVTFSLAPLLTRVISDFKIDYAQGGMLITIVAVMVLNDKMSFRRINRRFFN
jgi:predicted MFS family arabinose efflux permease